MLETQKLEKFLGTQHRDIVNIESAADDFLSFYPQFNTTPETSQQIWIVIGSERGFCGDFNESLVNVLNSNAQEKPLLIIVGSRLETKLHNDERITTFIKGHSVAEEVPLILLQLTEVLGKLQSLEPQKTAGISALYFDDESEQIRLRQLLPLTTSQIKPTYSHPPILNLEPAQFLSQLTEQYLYAVLHEVFYSSLMVENRKRLEHMDRAIHRLKKDEAALQLRYNRLRQEEIIEEIEIIMLSAEALLNED